MTDGRKGLMDIQTDIGLRTDRRYGDDNIHSANWLKAYKLYSDDFAS